MTVPEQIAKSATKPASPPHAKRVLIAIGVGNFVEWYDFAVYGYSAIVISQLFFPTGSRATSLLATLAVFGVAFIGRPLGAIFWGRVGDRHGRKRALAAVVLLIGVSTAAIGCLPTYDAIGIAAPILLVILRLLQGFSAGGQSSGAATYLSEYAPPDRRALWTGFSTCTQGFPFVLTALLVLLVSHLSGDAYEQWAWRIPFLIGAPLSLVGLYLRTKLEDTEAFREVVRQGNREGAPLMVVFKKYRRELLLVLVISGIDGLAFYALSGYLSTYLQSEAGLSSDDAFIANSIGLSLYLLVPLLGFLSDKFGRRRILFAGCIGHLILPIPGYYISGMGDLSHAIAGQILLAIPVMTVTSVVLIVQSELFPTEVRYSGGAFGYNVGYAVFGGTAPLVSQLLVDSFGLLAPAYYLMAAAAVVLLILVFKLPETSKWSMNRTGDMAQPG